MLGVLDENRYLNVALLACQLLLITAIYIPQLTSLMLIVNLLCLLLSFLRMNKHTMVIALNLFTPPLLALIFMYFSINITAYVLCVFLTFLLLWNEIREIIPKLLYWPIVCFFVFILIEFFLGPMHSYATTKLVMTFVRGLMAVIVFIICFRSYDIECEKLAQYFFFIAIMYISFSFALFDLPHPSSLFDFDFLRLYLQRYNLDEGDLSFTYHSIGISAMMGVAFLLAKKELHFNLNVVLSIIALVVVVFISQARQALLACVLIAIVRMLFQDTNSLKRIFLVLVTTVAFGYGLTNIQSETYSTTENATNVSDAVNRDYDQAYEIIDAHPIIGLGLGGYSKTGLREYPHNLILELICETGFLGLFFCLSLILSSFNGKLKSLKDISNSDFYLLLPVIGLFVRAMASSDLMENAMFIMALFVWSSFECDEQIYESNIYIQ